MKALWTQDAAEFHGEFYDFPPVRSYPKPVQKPHPPIILGGAAKNVLKRVVDHADGWLPNRINAGVVGGLGESFDRWPNLATQTVGRTVPLLVGGWILRGRWGFDYGTKFGRCIGQCGKCGLDRFADRAKFFCKLVDLFQ